MVNSESTKYFGYMERFPSRKDSLILAHPLALRGNLKAGFRNKFSFNQQHK